MNFVNKIYWYHLIYLFERNFILIIFFFTKRPFLSLLFLSHSRFSLVPVSSRHFCVPLLPFLRQSTLPFFFIFHKNLDSFNFFWYCSLSRQFLTVIFNSFVLHILLRSWFHGCCQRLSCLVFLGPFLQCVSIILVFWFLFRFLGLLSPCRLY